MADTYYLRFFMGPTLTFGWRDGLKCQKAYEEFEAQRCAWARVAALDLPADKRPETSPIVEIADDFGQRAAIDVRDRMIVMCTSTQHASEMNNAMCLGAMKGEMHMEKLLRDDEKLSSWVAVKQRMGQIIQPGPGTQQ
jgi:hypothetical protein